MTGRVKLWLLLLLLTLLLRSPAVFAAAFVPPYNKSIPVTLAVLWPADAITGFNAVSLPISLAVADLASSSTTLPTTLAVSYTDSTTSGQSTSRAAVTALASSSVIALLGTNDTFNSIAVSQIARAVTPTRPVFQTQSTATSLTVSASVIRTSYVVTEYGAVFGLLLQRYNWSSFCLFHTIDADSRDIVSYMISNVVSSNVTMHPYALSNIDAAAAPAIQSALSLVQQKQQRIVLVHGVQSLNILRAAAARGMLAAPMTWIGTDWCTQSVINTLRGEAVDVTGLLCIGGANAAPGNWSSFANRLAAMDPVTYPDPSLVPMSAGYVYDAVWVLALAMRAQQAANASLSLWTAATAVNYSGVTGPVTFYGSGGDRVGQLGLYNYESSTGLLATVGRWSGLEAASLVVTGDIVWSGGSAVPHRDSAGQYNQGEAVSVGHDSRLTLLSYAICVLGAWTGLILLEQSISARRMQLHLSSRPSPTNSATAVKSARRYYYVWIGWCALAATAFGLCSVWAVQALDLLAMQTDAGGLWLDSGVLFPPMLLAVALSFVSFAAVLSNTSFTASSDGEDSESSRDRSSHGSSAGTATRLSQTSKVVPLVSDNARMDVSKGGSTNSTSASDSHSTSSRRRHRTRQAELVLRLKHFLLTVLSLRLAFAACVLSLNTALLHWINQSALQGQAQLHADSTSLVHSAAVTLFTCWLPLWMFFYFHQSAGRFLAAFVMALALWGADQICQLGDSYTFDGTAAADGGSNAVSVVGTSALVIAVVACVVCLAMLVFNVFSLQLSAKVLARRQREVSVQVSAIQAELDACKAESAQLKEQTAAARQQVELVTYCRPVYRDFSVWIAMASTLSSQAATVVPAEGEVCLLPTPTGHSSLPAAGTVHPSAVLVSQQRGSVTSAERSTTNTQHSNYLSTPKAAPASPEPSNGKWAGSRGFGTVSAVDLPPPAIPSSYNSFVLVASSFTAPAAMWPRKDDNSVSKLRLASIHHPSPPPSIVLKQADLSLLLRHPVLLEVLKDSAVASFTPESLMLCSDLQLFHRIAQQASQSVLAAAARELYREYVVSGAAYEVNISATLRDDLRNNILNRSEVDNAVFRSAELEMIKLIATNQMAPFIASPLAQLAAAVLITAESTGGAAGGSVSSPAINVTTTSVGWDGSPVGSTRSTIVVKQETLPTTPSHRASASHRGTLTPTQPLVASRVWKSNKA